MNIVHIRSSGHSGSTLLNIILGNCSAVFGGAELFRYSRLWTRNDKMLCADGTPVKDSVFWQQVKHDMGDRCSRLAEDEINAEHVHVLMESILQHSGTEIVCDTSKSRKYFDVIYDKEKYDTFVVHLVRDGRAVVFSHKKKSIWDALKISTIWSISNMQTALRYRNKENYLLIRYEDLVFDYENVVNRVEKRISSHFNIQLTRNSYSKSSNTYRYAFAGNRMRETFTGDVRFDKRYIENTNFILWSLISLCTLPALFLFKYPISRTNSEKKYSGKPVVTGKTS